MPRLIEVLDPPACQAGLAIQPGDLLLFRAAAALLRSGDDVLESLGVLVAAVVGDGGAVVTPVGPPNVVLFRARRGGRARIDVVTGDPFHAPETTAIDVAVEA